MLRLGGVRRLFTLADLSPFPNRSPGTQTYHEQKVFPYGRKQLYDVVADVASYQHFVPFCTGSRILSQVQTNSVIMDAELTVGFLTMKESYVSRVTCQPFDSVEAVASPSSLFEKLVTTWRFEPVPQSPTVDDKTLVTLDLAFAFADPLHAAISAAFFGQVSKLMVQAFEGRCSTVYDTRHP